MDLNYEIYGVIKRYDFNKNLYILVNEDINYGLMSELGISDFLCKTMENIMLFKIRNISV
jgi:hypothetical protein